MTDRLPPGMDSDRVFYSAHFMDPAMWKPVVQAVCQQHGLGFTRIEPGFPGTFPTFMVELESGALGKPYSSVVVKFFGPLFDGAVSFRIEKAIGYWLNRHPLSVPSPAILADGQLDQLWSYLIFESVHGVSIRQVRQSLSKHAWGRVAEQMGLFMKALHTESATSLLEIAMPEGSSGWSEFIDFLECQRASCLFNHRQWGDLPSQLLDQVQDYLLPVAEIVDLSSPPHMIHADLTGDHLLGQLAEKKKLPPSGAEWDTLAIIDWGDTRIGNILYELVALHLDLFQSDLRLLKRFLEAYGLPDFYRNNFARKALCMVLLHQFPMPAHVYTPFKDTPTLGELAVNLFSIYDKD